MLREKFIVFYALIRKEERLQINDINFQLKKLGKKSRNKSQSEQNRQQLNGKTLKNVIKSKARFLKRIKLIKLQLDLTRKGDYKNYQHQA